MAVIALGINPGHGRMYDPCPPEHLGVSVSRHPFCVVCMRALSPREKSGTQLEDVKTRMQRASSVEPLHLMMHLVAHPVGQSGWYPQWRRWQSLI
jgi:hypothetical protein